MQQVTKSQRLSEYTGCRPIQFKSARPCLTKGKGEYRLTLTLTRDQMRAAETTNNIKYILKGAEYITYNMWFRERFNF